VLDLSKKLQEQGQKLNKTLGKVASLFPTTDKASPEDKAVSREKLEQLLDSILGTLDGIRISITKERPVKSQGSFDYNFRLYRNNEIIGGFSLNPSVTKITFENQLILHIQDLINKVFSKELDKVVGRQ
jgi:hypothetical protein